MPIDLASLGIGFVSGVAATAVAWSMTTRHVTNPEQTKLTAVWALDEVGRGHPPALMVERLVGLKVPAGSKILVPAGQPNAVPPDVLLACEVRMHPDVGMNYALGKDRALVFSSYMHPRAHAVYTYESAAVRKLQADFTRLWTEGEPYVEKVPLAAVAGMDGRHVEITGVAQELVEFRGRHMLRVSDGEHAVGVTTTQGNLADLQGKPVKVTGRVGRDGGYVYVEARSVERAARAAAVAPAP